MVRAFVALLAVVFGHLAQCKPGGESPTIQASGSTTIRTRVIDFDPDRYEVQVSVVWTNAPAFAKITGSIYDPQNQVYVAGTLVGGGTVATVTTNAGGAIFYYKVAKNSAWGTWIAGDGATVVFSAMWDGTWNTLIVASDYVDAYLE